MFSASYFTYDGVYSGTHGLMIADFDNNNTIETVTFSPVLNTYKPPASNRFFYNGLSYDSPPQFTFSILSETPIDDIKRREVLSWLVGRNNFKKLVIHQLDLMDCYYNCVFTDVSIIFVNAKCHGFRVTANFDSPYQHGNPSVVEIIGTGEEREVEVNNRSDIDGYVYPVVEFYNESNLYDDYSIKIINTTDSDSRLFAFKDVPEGSVVSVDNEIRHITGPNNGVMLSLFDDGNGAKNWLRLRKGINCLKVTVNGKVIIRCPRYIMMGF